METKDRPGKTEIAVGLDHDGRRLDRTLRGLFADVPLSAIMKAIRTGAVRVDGKKSAGDARLAEGEIVIVPWELRTAAKAPPSRAASRHPAQKLLTLYKDERVWFVSKPAGLLTQPDEKDGDSLITRAWRELGWTRADFRPACANRLDRNVSGVVAIALDGAMLRILAEIFRERTARKMYLATVTGAVEESGRIDIPLAKDAARNVAVASPDGAPALTLYRRVACDGALSLVELELVTGRPHQARAHMAAIGCPILGDRKYGGKAAKKISRIMLHAQSLQFSDDAPEPLRSLRVEAPLPEDFIVPAKRNAAAKR